MEGKQLATLEQALAELQAKDANTQHKLDILISHIPQSKNMITSTQITPVTPKAHCYERLQMNANVYHFT